MTSYYAKRSREPLTRGGFSIVELMVAVLILALVIAGAYPIVMQGERLQRQARDHYLAICMAKNRLERCRNFDYKDLYLFAESNLVVNAAGSAYAEGGFRRTTVVQTNYAPRLTEIAVTVEIKNRSAAAFQGEKETLKTLFTKYLEVAE